MSLLHCDTSSVARRRYEVRCDTTLSEWARVSSGESTGDCSTRGGTDGGSVTAAIVMGLSYSHVTVPLTRA